jgi:rod shape-determining protein MreC
MAKRSTSLKVITCVAVFIALEVVSIVLVAKNSIIQHSRIIGGMRGIQTWFWKGGEHLKYYFSLQKTNEDLAAENAQLRQELDGYKQYLESKDSTIAVDFPGDSLREASYYEYLPATVILNTVNKQHNYLVLNKGSKDGVKVDMGVIGANGIVGSINSVSEHFSYVTSFLNTSASVSAKIDKNNAFGPMVWEGRRTDRAVIKEIPLNANPQRGDTVSTSGYSLMYPSGIPLGVVRDHKIVNGEQLYVSVDLFQNFNTLHLVKIVINRRGGELKDLIKQ